jgi:tetratricopeptide (TPR) repeat protein
MAHDLGTPFRPVGLLALAQYRLLGAARVAQRLSFERPLSKTIALQGFDRAYNEATVTLLRGMSDTGLYGRLEMARFLEGPLARLDLFAPDQEESAVRLAAALSSVGLRQAGAVVLQKAVAAGQGTCAVHACLGGILEGMARRPEAVQQYRRALEIEPGSTSTAKRLVALLLKMKRAEEAIEALEQLAEHAPQDKINLLMLGNLYARVKRYDDAASTALKVLHLDPNDADAAALLALSREASAAE